MKLLIIGPEIRRLSEVKNYGGIQAYYLTRELETLGVKLSFVPQYHTPDAASLYAAHTVRADHALALGVRFLSRSPDARRKAIRGLVRGRVAQIHDGATPLPRYVDVTFTVKNESAPRGACEHIGWAADPALFVPRQRERPLVLIDHPDYVSGRGDESERVTAHARAFHSADLMWIADHGVNSSPVATYNRQHTGVESMAKVYGAAHYFMVTHKESVGLTVLEACMAGALPLVPQGFVHSSLLQTIHAIQYPLDIPSADLWNHARSIYNPDRQRHSSMGNTWRRVAKRLVNWFESG